MSAWTLAGAGVPLARIDALLHAQPTEFAAAITDIDAELQGKIDELTDYRRRIAELARDQSVDWDPHDPRLDPLIDDLDAGEIEHERDNSQAST
jgi:DNA-binding transcriptional MerR regulator